MRFMNKSLIFMIKHVRCTLLIQLNNVCHSMSGSYNNVVRITQSVRMKVLPIRTHRISITACFANKLGAKDAPHKNIRKGIEAISHYHLLMVAKWIYWMAQRMIAHGNSHWEWFRLLEFCSRFKSEFAQNGIHLNINDSRNLCKYVFTFIIRYIFGVIIHVCIKNELKT